MQNLPESLIERIALLVQPRDRLAMRRSSRVIRNGMRHIPLDRMEIVHAVLHQIALSRRTCLELSFKPVFGLVGLGTISNRPVRVFPQNNGLFTMVFRSRARKEKNVTLATVLAFLQQPERTVAEASIYRIRPTSPKFRPANYIRTTTVGRSLYRKRFEA